MVAMTAFVLLASACGSKKVLVDDNKGKVDATTSATTTPTTKPQTQPTGAETLNVKKANYVLLMANHCV